MSLPVFWESKISCRFALINSSSRPIITRIAVAVNVVLNVWFVKSRRIAVGMSSFSRTYALMSLVHLCNDFFLEGEREWLSLWGREGRGRESRVKGIAYRVIAAAIGFAYSTRLILFHRRFRRKKGWWCVHIGVRPNTLEARSVNYHGNQKNKTWFFFLKIKKKPPAGRIFLEKKINKTRCL